MPKKSKLLTSKVRRSRLNETIPSHDRTSEMHEASTNGTFTNTMNVHQTNEHQTNELQQTTTNALYISTDSHEHILEPQVTAITEATNIETKQQKQQISPG